MTAIARVCVFCGASPGVGPAYLELARSVGRGLAERGLGLVYGGVKNKPIIAKLVEVGGTYGQSWHLLTASAFVSMVVPLLVFFALQRYFVRGLLLFAGQVFLFVEVAVARHLQFADVAAFAAASTAPAAALLLLHLGVARF